MKKGLPYSQLLRVRRIVSDEDTCRVRLDEMAECFIQRGNNRAVVESQKSKVMSLKREELLVNKAPNRNINRVPFTSTLNANSKHIKIIIHKHWEIVQKDNEFGKNFSEILLCSYNT
ncbi:hypothetical protein XELAEV_18012338mg [Xenopus laevis]|uniref:Uncharacterized protein n=1 Tax=Xenopus laevis TaxID=8355 RepID=A0A974HYA8_XENLA|nr:hypothetical protein XELAEV_18012338mg [Xenopus laevis]